MMRNAIRMAVPAAALAFHVSTACAQEDLREAAQNPIANMISLPFQNETNFGLGNTDNTQNVLNIQPVFPVRLNDDWNLIIRPILPVIYQEPFLAGEELQEAERVFGDDIGNSHFGLGDLTPEFFFSPSKPVELAPDVSLVWGAGPVFQIPTATNNLLGTGKWSAGPGFVTFLSVKPLKITTGFLAINLWSFAGDDDRSDVNALTFQPFLNYNLANGWYLTTSPVITANWEAAGDNRWTVPAGGGIGRIFEIGHQPVNAQVSAYYNIVKPDDTGPDWQLRAQLTFLFPTR
ncbi:hypothetical protein FHT82_005442 [Rhizobium sp. BK275]|uniref:transporter n=1 Tax=Rhizobium sp. BK275 TaxID=2587077 RepID=UPI0017DE5E7C|nr:transporter [Rhizobium sp. BK275]MBB3392655.1 hypothetical protein [Rhizobium sp. BK275]